jgi:hypothetical protein
MAESDPETPPLAPDAVPAQPPILARRAEPAARHLAHTTAPTAADYARQALAPSTIQRYAADWSDFVGCAALRGGWESQQPRHARAPHRLHTAPVEG